MSALQFYESELKRLKSDTARKSYLTRNINSARRHLIDMRYAYSKRGSRDYGMLLGEKITPHKINSMLTEIKVMENLKKQIK